MMKLHYIKIKYVKVLIGIISILSLFSSCHSRLHDALEAAGENREEMEQVLAYFKNDSDTLKYSAAKFLIENMPYHYTYVGKEMEQYNAAYIRAALEPKEFRDSVFDAANKDIKLEKAKPAFDIKTVKADYLISAINDACELWHKVNWRNDYSVEIFYDYVLPYRILNENLSSWRKIIAEEYPDLIDGTVASRRGIILSADTAKLSHAEIKDTPSASSGKVVLCADKKSSITFHVSSACLVSKRLLLRYTTVNKGTKIAIRLNGKELEDLTLEPTKNIHVFKTTRKGIDIVLEKGENVLSIEYKSGLFGLDLVQLGTLEKLHQDMLTDFSGKVCRIKNVSSHKYIVLDTLNASKLKALRLIGDKDDVQARLRLCYEGYPAWRICPIDDDKQCLEVRYCSLEENAIIGKYDFLKGNHQRWIFSPLKNGEYKIWNKDTGKCLEDACDFMTGSDSLVQTSWRAAESQKWKVETEVKKLEEEPAFSFGSALSEALKVYDMMAQFEWISLKGSIPPKASSLLMNRTGNCRDEASYVVYLSRSLGIPAAIDFTPHWGNRANSHSWSVLLKPDGKGTPFYMGCVPGDTAQYFHPYKKPKVYRRTFRVNRKILGDLKGEEKVPSLFRIPTFIDVTDEYYDTKDIERDILHEYSDRKVAYICVYDNKQWEPVDYGMIESGKTLFKSMVRGILYSVCIYQEGKMIPIGNPFVLENNGRVRDIVPHAQKITLRLNRKYPYMGREDYFNFRMWNGKFQGSNSAEFTHAKDLYQFEGMTEGCWYQRDITDKGYYRYLRYIGPNGSYCNINELEFYDKNGRKLFGEILGTNGVSGKTKETVFDGDILTGFQGDSPDGHWVGLRLPEPSQVGWIRFIPRNDGNCIEIGDKYQLMMYDDCQWKVLATRIAASDVICFPHVPSGGLYLLSNLTKGSEERIFTYEKGKQVWW